MPASCTLFAWIHFETIGAAVRHLRFQLQDVGIGKKPRTYVTVGLGGMLEVASLACL
jgi:hypothetical protein